MEIETAINGPITKETLIEFHRRSQDVICEYQNLDKIQASLLELNKIALLMMTSLLCDIREELKKQNQDRD